MASANYASVLATTIARASGWQALLAAELVTNPPLLSQRERETLLTIALVPAAASQAYESLITTRVLTIDDNGKMFGLNLAGGFTSTLPLISTLPANWSCKFRVETAPTTDYIVIANATDLDKMAGHVLSSSGAAEDTEGTATGDQVNFISAGSASKVGDWLEVSTNGTSWYVRAECATAAAITITG